MKASDGTTSPISHRWRFLSRQPSVEPAETVLFAIADIRGASCQWLTEP